MRYLEWIKRINFRVFILSKLWSWWWLYDDGVAMPDPPELPECVWNGQAMSHKLYDFLKINLVYDHRERASLKRLWKHPFITGRNRENKCNHDHDDIKMGNNKSNESNLKIYRLIINKKMKLQNYQKLKKNETEKTARNQWIEMDEKGRDWVKQN